MDTTIKRVRVSSGGKPAAANSRQALVLIAD
jgi:hypothetical protein